MKYLALLRGINVGGNSMIAMSDLRECLENAGFDQVRTYIQSGNVLFAARRTGTSVLAARIERAVEKTFVMKVGVTVFTADEWEEVVRLAPNWWGKDKEWKHNLLALLPGTESAEVIDAMAGLKLDRERVAAGPRVVYQSVSADMPGRTTTSKLLSHAIYGRVTIRNYNTTHKLAELLRGDSYDG